jgi:hypothetical protein
MVEWLAWRAHGFVSRTSLLDGVRTEFDLEFKPRRLETLITKLVRADRLVKVSPSLFVHVAHADDFWRTRRDPNEKACQPRMLEWLVWKADGVIGVPELLQKMKHFFDADLHQAHVSMLATRLVGESRILRVERGCYLHVKHAHPRHFPDYNPYAPHQVSLDESPLDTSPTDVRWSLKRQAQFVERLLYEARDYVMTSYIRRAIREHFKLTRAPSNITPTLQALARDGKIIRVEQGTYLHAEHANTPPRLLQLVQFKSPPQPAQPQPPIDIFS